MANSPIDPAGLSPVPVPLTGGEWVAVHQNGAIHRAQASSLAGLSAGSIPIQSRPPSDVIDALSFAPVTLAGTELVVVSQNGGLFTTTVSDLNTLSAGSGTPAPLNPANPIDQLTPVPVTMTGVELVAVLQGGALRKAATSSVGGGAPAAPANLTATAGNGQVSLSWSALPGNVTSVTVYRGTTPGGESSLVTGVSPTPPYVDSSGTAGTLYYYKITAVSSGGESPKSNEASATPFTAPGSISGLVLDLDPNIGAFKDLGTTPCSNGDLCEQLNDQSSSANNVTQTTSGNRATFQTNQINGLPALSFSSSWYSFGSGFTAANLSVYAVCNVAGNNGYALLGGAGGNPQFRIGFDGSSNSNTKIYHQDGGSPTASTDMTLGQWENIVWMVGSGGAGAQYRQNGAAFGAPTSTNATNITTLGALVNGGANKLTGSLGRLLIYNKLLSAAEIAGLEAYIANKYGFL